MSAVGQASEAISSTQKGTMAKKVRNTVSIAVAAAAMLAMLVAAAPASADVEWKADIRTAPTNMVPGERAGMIILPGNAGNTAPSGYPTITAELPPGLTFAEAGISFFWSCTGTTTLTCTGPGFGFPPVHGYANPFFALGLIVAVAPGASEGRFDVPVKMEGGGATTPTTQVAQLTIADNPTEFGIEPGTAAGAFDDEGNPYTQAGGHPYEASATFASTTKFNDPMGDPSAFSRMARNVDLIKDVVADIPAGFVGDPTVVPTCEDMSKVQEHLCPPESQIGVATFAQLSQAGKRMAGVYNMEPDAGVPAMFGFDTPVGAATLKPVVRSDGDWGISIKVRNLTEAGELYKTTTTLWGVPADPRHDLQRCALPNELTRTCNGLDSLGIPWTMTGEPESVALPHSSDAPMAPFLTNPTHCGGQELTKINLSGWHNPAAFEPNGDPDLSDPNWKTATAESPSLTGCNALEFVPTLKARPTTNAADSPTGLEVDLHIPQNEDFDGTASAHLKKAVVTLPEGLVINPSGANGLLACSPAQIGLKVRESGTCPDASKVGTVQVESPALDNPVPGSVYVATPHDNPFNSLLALYIEVDDPKTGIVGKLAGEVTPDPRTGRLTTTFDQNPQLPFEHFKLNFFSGAAAPLRTPATCGNYATTSELTPWSAPESGPPATPADNYAISQGANGRACAASPAQLPNAPSFEAGATSPLAGNYSPFVVNLRRDDGSQQFSSVTLSPPPGVVAKLAGTAICPDGALAAAAARNGRQEQASPSCPVASEVGAAFAGAGAGPAPYYADGKAYLAGPYKGAPMSLAIVTPAVAGPFDLGTIVVRTALYLNSRTAQITAVSDPIPAILKGIPLDVRSVSIRIDKPRFTLNPTSCDPTAVAGQLLSTEGQTAALDNRFQLAECGRLGFKPRMTLKLKGGTKRDKNPALTVVLKPRPGDANIARVSVAMPPSEFLDQAHINTVCTRVQFAADRCPRGAIYGTVSVTTPLLDYPLTGPVYLRSSDNDLPDLVPDLRGPAYQPLKLEAAGRTDSIRGGLRNTFDFVPDAPFTKMVLKMKGGKKGLLVNSRNICAKPYRARVDYGAHNGATFSAQPLLKAKCPKQGNKAKKKSKQPGKR